MQEYLYEFTDLSNEMFNNEQGNLTLNSNESIILSFNTSNTEIDITDVASDTTNYLVIQVDMAATSDLLYGGYVTIIES